MNYAINDSSPYRPHPSKCKVIEDSARTANQSYSYTGTVRTVGSGKTHATLTAAYAACSSGDIIEVYGTINLNSETGGYWLINNSINVLVRGSTSNPSDTILTQGTAVSYGVRCRVNSGIVFQNLTITTNQNITPIYVDLDQANRNMVFDNCIITNTNGGATSARCFYINGVQDTKTNYFEFKNCTFTKNNTSKFLEFDLGGINTTVLLTNNTFNCTNSPALEPRATFLGNIIFYNNTVLMNSNTIALQFGNDTTKPSTSINSVDVRGNVVKFNQTFVQHGILLGRGTNTVKCYNNEVYMMSSSDASAIGLVVKTTSTNVGDSLIKGNFVYAPRPFYIKGGSKTTTSNNIFVSNYDNGSNWECFGFVNYKNGADEVLSRSNVVTYNTFMSTHNAIHIYDEVGGSESSVVSFKTGTYNYNKFYMNADRYLVDLISNTSYSWDNRDLFFGASSENELYSTKINSVVIQNFL